MGTELGLSLEQINQLIQIATDWYRRNGAVMEINESDILVLFNAMRSTEMYSSPDMRGHNK